MAPCRGSAHAVRGDYDGVVNALLHDIGGADGDCGDDVGDDVGDDDDDD